jgi:hypothetical protein
MLSASSAAACMASLFASSLLSLLLGIALRETLTAILSSCGTQQSSSCHCARSTLQMRANQHRREAR